MKSIKFTNNEIRSITENIRVLRVAVDELERVLGPVVSAGDKLEQERLLRQAIPRQPVEPEPVDRELFDTMMMFMIMLGMTTFLIDAVGSMSQPGSGIPLFEPVYIDKAAWLQARKILSAREFIVLRLRYGAGGNPLSLGDIGEKFGLTRERIRQIQVAAEKKLSAAELLVR